MAPFNGHPEGFSAVDAGLLDQGLNEIWHDMQIAARRKDAPSRRRRTSPADVHDQRSRLRRRSRTVAAVIAK